MSRRFELVRLEDTSGVSGTGVVGEGIEFTDGTCVLRWVTGLQSTTFYEDMETLVAIHGHDGRTIVDWVDKS